MEQDRRDYRAGVIAAEVRNTMRTKPNQKVWEAWDFFHERSKVKPKPMTVQQSVDYVATLNRLLGGVDLREPVG